MTHWRFFFTTFEDRGADSAFDQLGRCDFEGAKYNSDLLDGSGRWWHSTFLAYHGTRLGDSRKPIWITRDRAEELVAELLASGRLVVPPKGLAQGTPVDVTALLEAKLTPNWRYFVIGPRQPYPRAVDRPLCRSNTQVGDLHADELSEKGRWKPSRFLINRHYLEYTDEDYEWITEEQAKRIIADKLVAGRISEAPDEP